MNPSYYHILDRTLLNFPLSLLNPPPPPTPHPSPLIPSPSFHHCTTRLQSPPTQIYQSPHLRSYPHPPAFLFLQLKLFSTPAATVSAHLAVCCLSRRPCGPTTAHRATQQHSLHKSALLAFPPMWHTSQTQSRSFLDSIFYVCKPWPHSLHPPGYCVLQVANTLR